MVPLSSLRLVRLGIGLLALLTLGLCVVVWQELETTLKDEHQQVSDFEELAAYHVVNAVGFELFQLHFNFSFRIRELMESPGTDWAREVAAMAETYRQRARHPELLEDVVLVAAPARGPLQWKCLIGSDWTSSSARPDWLPDGDDLFHQPIDPTVSLERPYLMFPMPPSGGTRQVLLVRYRVQEVLDQIVPALATKAFARREGRKDYSVALTRQTPLLTLDPGVDVVVPLVPEVRFSEWLRTYLGQNELSPPSVGPREFRNLTRADLFQAHWALQIKLLPDGLESHIRAERGRNLMAVAALLVLLWAGLAALAFSIFRTLKADERERVFTTLVSHELKTPLAALRSLSENLADGYVKGDQQLQAYGSQIGEQTERLSRLVGNILSHAQDQGGRGPWEREVFDLLAVVREVVASTPVSVVAAQGNWDVQGNQAAIRAAVDNLVTNALKYGFQKGTEPDVTVVLGKERRGSARVWLAVIDHGPGLTRTERRQLFRPYRRGQRAIDQQIPGSGLGLSLVRTSLRHGGGRVRAAATPGGGLTVTLWLQEGSR